MDPADDHDRLLSSVIGSAMDVRFRFASLILCFWAVAAQAQSPPPNQPYTIQTNSRVVLTDVTVTDQVPVVVLASRVCAGLPVHDDPE